MDCNGHYKFIEHEAVSRGDYSKNKLVCVHCNFTLWLRNYYKAGDKSGAPRYCRARGQMVKHLHEKHRNELAKGPLKERLPEHLRSW